MAGVWRQLGEVQDILTCTPTSVKGVLPTTASKYVLCVVSAAFLFKLVAVVLNELGEVLDIQTLVTNLTVIVFPITTPELVLHVVRVLFLFKLVAAEC